MSKEIEEAIRDTIQKLDAFYEQIQKERIEKGGPKPNKRFKPNDGQGYWTMHEDFDIFNATWTNHPVDRHRYIIGVVFRTRQEVLDWAENKQTESDLIDLIAEINGDRVIDWSNRSQKKHFLYYNNSISEICCGHNDVCKSRPNSIHCYRDVKEDVIERIGEKRLTKYLKY